MEQEFTMKTESTDDPATCIAATVRILKRTSLDESTALSRHTEDYRKLIDYGFDRKVASELDDIYKSGLLCHGDLENRALDDLKELSPERGYTVIKDFKECNLEYISNKSAYLCGIIQIYKKLQDAGRQGKKKPGLNKEKLKEILKATGYQLDYTISRRTYGGPPPDWKGPQPGAGHEVVCRRIPKQVFEDELIPLFEKFGKIWELRLMMNPLSGKTKGFCFVIFCDKDGAEEAVKQLDNYEFQPGKRLSMEKTVANVRLFVGNIPESKSKDEIMEEFKKLTENLQDVIISSSPDDSKKKNHGFALLQYATNTDANEALARIDNVIPRTRVWNRDIIVDWADPGEEPDNDIMSKLNVLYVRNLKAEVTKEQITKHFLSHGKIEQVKRGRNYSFVHFENNKAALKAMEELNGSCLGITEINVSLVMPWDKLKEKQGEGKERVEPQGTKGGKSPQQKEGARRKRRGRAQGGLQDTRGSMSSQQRGGTRGMRHGYDWGGPQGTRGGMFSQQQGRAREMGQSDYDGYVGGPYGGYGIHGGPQGTRRGMSSRQQGRAREIGQGDYHGYNGGPRGGYGIHGGPQGTRRGMSPQQQRRTREMGQGDYHGYSGGPPGGYGMHDGPQGTRGSKSTQPLGRAGEMGQGDYHGYVSGPPGGYGIYGGPQGTRRVMSSQQLGGSGGRGGSGPQGTRRVMSSQQLGGSGGMGGSGPQGTRRVMSSQQLEGSGGMGRGDYYGIYATGKGAATANLRGEPVSSAFTAGKRGGDNQFSIGPQAKNRHTQDS